MREITIIVDGHPEPGGSKTVFPIVNRQWRHGMPGHLRYLHDKHGRPAFALTDANTKAKAWKKLVVQAAADQYSGPLLDGPLVVSITVYLGRPKNHYGTGRNAGVLKASAPRYPLGPPDRGKFARPIEDALTGVVWTDDSRVIGGAVEKRYAQGVVPRGGPGEHAVIHIFEREARTVGEAQTRRLAQAA